MDLGEAAVIARRPKADEAISTIRIIEIASAGFASLAMTGKPVLT